jgi:hypothetical protein
MTAEKKRLIEDRDRQKNWRQWGPYLTDRQWGTVREDYSANGDSWNYVSHDMARSKAYRWGEEGIAGISDNQQLLCISLALWNKKDPILKERYFGLTNPEGNHGEDVKEVYYYLDSTPTHSYMRMLYKYPHNEYPYALLTEESKRRGKQDPEFELMDSGIFAFNRYFDVEVAYAKGDANDILMQITVTNRGAETASIDVLPTIWFRNTWAWGNDPYKPEIYLDDKGAMKAVHQQSGNYYFYCDTRSEAIFCENETNTFRLHDYYKEGSFKDGINDYVVFDHPGTINKAHRGTKAAFRADWEIGPSQSKVMRLRLAPGYMAKPFQQFDTLFEKRKQEADEFYAAEDHFE